jgi:DNA-binding NtrC family response regulator
MAQDATILIVDDDADILLAAQLLLRDHFAHVLTCQSPEDVPALFARRAIDVVLLDMNFARGETSGAEGFTWLARLQAIDADIVVVVITAHGGVQLAVEAMRRGASDFVSKPWSNERLLATVSAALELRRGRLRANTLEQKAIVASTGPAQMLLGASPAMQKVQQLIERAAPSRFSCRLI